MGCQSSMDLYEPKSFRGKTLIWLLGGGPGSPKQQVAHFLVDKFKFKYLSALDLIRFEQNTGSPESNQIKKCIQSKQEFSSDLIIRILRRSMTLYGPRKYLLDGFPRSEADVQELKNLCSKFNQVQILGYIQLELSEKQMKQSGLKTLRQIRKNSELETVQKQVRSIIESYRFRFRPVLQYYQSVDKLIKVDFTDQNVNLMNEKLEQLLKQKDLTPVQLVPLHFLHGNNSKQIELFAIKLSKQLGIMSWGIQQLVQQAKTKFELKKEASKQLSEISSNFLVQLIAKKLERYNYKGEFLLWGYPRTQEDLKALRVYFLRELHFATFSCCLHTPTTQKQQTTFQNLEAYLNQFENTPCLIEHANDNAYQSISKHIKKTIAPVISSGKLLIIPCLENEGINNGFAKLPEYQYNQFTGLIKKEIAKKDLYSQLLESCLTLNKHVPAVLAISIVFNALRTYEQNNLMAQGQTKPLIVRGFPQNIQQVKCLLSRSPQTKILGCVIFDYKAQKCSNEAKLAQFQKLTDILKISCNPFQRFSLKTTVDQYKQFLTQITQM